MGQTKEALLRKLSHLQLSALEHVIREEWYKTIVAYANDPIFIADSELGIIVDVNIKAQELTGYSREELIGMHQSHLHPAHALDGEFSETFIKHALIGTSHRDEDKIVRKDGTILDVSISAGVIALPTGKLIIGIFRDITGQKKITRQHKRHENAIKKKLDITERRGKEQGIINSILQIAVSHESLGVQLQKILEIIMKNTMISLQSKGCIFLCNDAEETLLIIAAHNFSPQQMAVCTKIPYGTCICGIAASTKSVVLSSSCDDPRHTIKYADMTPHRHYCIPIISSDKLLGLINVYV
ncbi:MAG: PAS domain S-box protein, partial [Candidatus Magnetominusculus sp. LBB02]|nr:PAS domain S-box protein [Candidatus Magnetominusculus sp. LBB02]